MFDYRAVADQLIGWAVLFHDAESFEDLADLSIERLLAETGLDGAVHAIALDEAADSVVKRLEVGTAFEAFMQSLDARRQVIALRRTYADHPEILEELGTEFGVTRERARQLETDVRQAFSDFAGIRFMQSAIRLRQTLPQVICEERLTRILDRLVEQATPDTRTAAKVALLQHIGYEKVGALELWASRAFRASVNDLQERAADFADEHGVVDESRLRESLGVGPDKTWVSLTKAAGLKRVLGHFVIRDTREARLYLALRLFSKPATKEELAERTDLDVRSVAAALSANHSFVRITKDTWGLPGWTDDPYDGVVGEILQRIEAGGGQASVQHLLTEIPDRFGVSPATVHTYLATPKFSVDGDVVRISETVDVDVTPLSSLREVVWTKDGQPVLRVTLAPIHLDGYSIKVPAAAAMHLGVGPDSEGVVPVLEPEGCQNASLIWRAHDPSGPEIGRLREALVAVGATAGGDVFIVLNTDSVTVTQEGGDFLPTRPRVEPAHEQPVPRALNGLESPALERMKSRRRI